MLYADCAFGILYSVVRDPLEALDILLAVAAPMEPTL